MRNESLLFKSGNTAMIIAPHPDDETFGCGGTIAKMVASGMKVFVLAISVGNLRQIEADSNTNKRKLEFACACKKLGVQEGEIYFESDDVHMKLDTIPQMDLVNIIERKARISLINIRPDILFIPFSGGFNQDHKAVHSAAFTAARPHHSNQKPTPRIVLGYSIPDEMAWTLNPNPAPMYVDISDYQTQKNEALSCYQSQIRPDKHPRSIKNIKLRDIALGSDIGIQAAESFSIYRILI